MIETYPIARRSAAQLLLGPLAFFLAPSAETLAREADQEKVAAENVAKKLERAKKSKVREDKQAQEVLADFKKELAEYTKLHNKEAAKIGAIDSEAGQKALANAIKAKRAGTRQGDIFLVPIQPLFRKLLVEQLKGPDSLPAQKAVAEGNPGHDEDSPPIALGVNIVYPRGATRSTVPPSVLVTLPPLPDCLNYLFVGRNLILIDTKAQLIVDYLPAAAPELIK